MEKINVAELLRNCPKGMELDCTAFEGVTLSSVNTNRAYPIHIRLSCGNLKSLTSEGGLNHTEGAKCIIFPKGKTTWEGFVPPCQFKDGDVVYTSMDSIAILGDRIGEHSESFNSYCGLFNYEFNTDVVVLPERFATEEEKQKLFDAIKSNGYKWNPETKTLEELVEPKFKVGDIAVSDKGDIHLLRTEDSSYCVYRVLWRGLAQFDKTITTSVRVERLATEKEKEKFFQAIKDNGYRWNEETKTLEKLPPNKFDINTLVPFESKVLVRNDEGQYWIPAFWGCKRADGYTTTFGWCKYCIPYEGNEYLLETNNDCNEYYKTWK